jgi:hypothetical protein
VPSTNRGQHIRQRIQKLQKTSQRAKHYKAPTEGLSGIYRAGYERDVNTLNTNKQQALSGTRYQQGELTNKYGFGQDPSQNPYSMAAQLQSQLGQANKTSVNSYASKGQLYSGALTSNALGTNLEGYNKNYEGLRRSYLGAKSKLIDTANAAKTEYRQARPDSMQKWIGEQNKEDPDSTAAPRGPYKSQKFYGKRIGQLRHKLNRRKRG